MNELPNDPHIQEVINVIEFKISEHVSSYIHNNKELIHPPVGGLLIMKEIHSISNRIKEDLNNDPDFSLSEYGVENAVNIAVERIEKKVFQQEEESLKLSDEYYGYTEAIMLIIEDNNYNLVSDDYDSLIYQVPIANVKDGNNFYILKNGGEGNVYFKLITIINSNEVCQTTSKEYNYDLHSDDWEKVILGVKSVHYSKPQYRFEISKSKSRDFVEASEAFLEQSFKVSQQSKSGCAFFILILVLVSSSLIFSLFQF
ncbi:MAG: hypothetical protein CMC13_11275 [Flavobacteriaceae bacterium]|nr:hypothetical protein [Flavobacteriaceae bacterium]|tara:strand:- start:13389 stop:14159 length:771 start_codon:yes stop_codon:yes gene_type:complete